MTSELKTTVVSVTFKNNIMSLNKPIKEQTDVAVTGKKYYVSTCEQFSASQFSISVQFFKNLCCVSVTIMTKACLKGTKIKTA